ncbi:multidrug transporter [Longimycelium tulufanense]|uniref:Multidrug transporter n=1 Tax=Longimycelium tulufanense TaxID=907463 RepID=A0A8J3C6H9_9PSEU|nr:DMT family transporter [Longimycelium tulufanense]GGM39755.1 multidrug transporter [Longimycelium tulufanense]
MQPTSVLRLLLLTGLWGSSYLLIKLSLGATSPFGVLLGRLVLGAGFLVAVTSLRRQPLPRSPRLWGYLTIAAIFANMVPYFLLAWAGQRVPSALAGVLNSTTPLFTYVMAIALGERAQRHRIVGLLLGLLGVAVLLAPWRSATSHVSWTASAACLVAAASYGVSYIYIGRFLTGASGNQCPLLAASAGQLVAASAVVTTALPFVGPIALTPGWTGVVALLVLGVLVTGAANLLKYRLIADEGPTAASTVIYLLPLVAVTMGVLAGEALGWHIYLGAGVVLVGVVLANQPQPASQATGQIR